MPTNISELAKELIFSRMRKFMWLLRGWGVTSIRFTSEKEKAAKDAATMFKQDLEAHKALKANATPELEPIIAKSPLIMCHYSKWLPSLRGLAMR